MNRITTHSLPLLAALLLAGCASTPERIDVLEDARMTIDQVETLPRAQGVAGDELAKARQALQRADRLYDDNADYDDIYHQAYMALRHAEIARERIAEATTRELIASSEAERNQVLLLAREAEADAARAQARESGREADLARSIAAIREAEAAEARDLAAAQAAEAEQARDFAVAKAREAEASERRTELAEAETQMALEEQQRLQAQLAAMEAEQTERGYVLTLSDILFDTDRSTLKPGADNTLDELAAFLREYPDRRLLIEGHTDARGTEAYNLALSEDRAEAVQQALATRGIATDRVDVRPMGEEFPVATNETTAGMLQNRRVEIVISDPDGQFPASALRTVSR